MTQDNKLPPNFQAYKRYVVERLEQYPLACHKTQRRLWARQMRLAVGAGAKDATLIRINPNYKRRELLEQIRWYRHSQTGRASDIAFMAFAKAIGAPTYKEYLRDGRESAHDSS